MEEAWVIRANCAAVAEGRVGVPRDRDFSARHPGLVVPWG